MNYQILLVSQFTLYAVLKGNKPDFHKAMNAEKAREYFEHMHKEIAKKYDP